MKWLLVIALAAILAGCGETQADYVKMFLNDPESAQFRDVRQSRRDKNAWCGELNAKNRVGGMIGYTKYIVILPEERRGDRGMKQALTRFYAADNDGFEAKWRLWCE